MTDIRRAIADLRDAINGGEGWPTIHRAYEALENTMLERYGVNEPMDKFKLFEKALLTTWPVKWDDVESRLTALESAVTGDDLTERIQAAAEEIATKADEGWPALRCDKCGSLELIRNVPEDGYDCRGCSNFTRTPDEVIGITKIDLEKLATAIIKRHLEVK